MVYKIDIRIPTMRDAADSETCWKFLLDWWANDCHNQIVLRIDAPETGQGRLEAATKR